MSQEDSDRGTDVGNVDQTKQDVGTNEQFRATSSKISYGESVTDVINRPDTKPIIKQTVGLFAAVGIGIGILAFVAIGSFDEGLGEIIGGSIIIIIAGLFAAVSGPVVASFTSIRILGLLPDLKDDLVYSTGFIATGVGQLILLSTVIFLSTLQVSGEDGLGFGDFTGVIVISAVVTGGVSALSIYLLKTLPDPQEV